VRRAPELYRKFGEKFLQNKHQRGVVDLDPSHQREDKNFVIHLLLGGTFEERTLSNLFTPDKINQAISDTLQNCGLPNADFLYALLVECLEPNVTYDKLNSELARK